MGRQEMTEKIRGCRMLILTILASYLIFGIGHNARADSLTPFKGERGTIRISGGTAHIPVMKELAKRIMRFNPDIQISIAGGGSGVGIKQAGEGLVNIGNSGRRPSEAEISKYHLKMFRWAIDGVAIAVNPKNPVRNISGPQLQEIFADRITNWQALGGLDKPINLYTRDKASGTRTVFWKKALRKSDISNRANFIPSNGAMKSAIATDPYSIGYLSAGYLDESVVAVVFDDISPTIKNIKNGSYRVSRGLYSNTKGKPTGLTKKFIDYIFSPESQRLIAEKGFVPVHQ